jgi:hypothetical protein
MLACLFLSVITLTPATAQDAGEDHFEYFNDLAGDAWLKANADMVERHLQRWVSATGDERKREASALRFYSWRAERMDVFDRVLSDDRLAETEVKIPAESATVTVTVKQEVPVDPEENWPKSPTWRRITPTTLEIWTPQHGWLFDRRGDLIHTAQPPRKDGSGRQWFGAFLPDGRWITTELLQDDKRVYIFNARGRCTHEIKAGMLIPPTDPSNLYEPISLVPWARSNRTGDAWVVRIGSEGGRGEVLLWPDGTSKVIKRPSSPWRHCLTRQLGVRLRGGVSHYGCESDDGKLFMNSAQPAHGPGVGRPSYEVRGTTGKPDEAPVWSSPIPSDGREFGFWPASRATYVFNGVRTWFFDAAGHYQGWIAGERIGDAADGSGMIFRLQDFRCVTVSSTLKPATSQNFKLADGTSLTPLELHPDLGLGMFALAKPKTGTDADIEDVTGLAELPEILLRSRSVVLAKWAIPSPKKK